MAKLPTKGDGVTATERGFSIHCQSNGEYKGVPKFIWVHEDGSQVYRKVNGDIKFVEPSGSESAPVSVANVVPLFGTLKGESLSEIERYIVGKEERLCSLAADVARDRYPEMKESSQTFGMIVNAIKGSLITLSSV